MPSTTLETESELGMINLDALKDVLSEVGALVQELDGQDLDETDAITSQSKGEVRRRKAELSQKIQLLAVRLELGAALARNEYWYARGNRDPLNPQRND